MWLKLPMGWGLPALVLAPAEAAVRWRGRDGDGVRITFQYWQSLYDKLPAELRPTRGHHDTPHASLASQADATAHVEKLRQFVATLHPDVTVKKQKNLNLTRFLAGDADYRLIIAPESAAEVAFETIDPAISAWPWPAGDTEVLMWRFANRTLRVRATADEIVFVASSLEDDALAAAIAGEPTDHGTWTFAGVWSACGARSR